MTLPRMHLPSREVMALEKRVAELEAIPPAIQLQRSYLSLRDRVMDLDKRNVKVMAIIAEAWEDSDSQNPFVADILGGIETILKEKI